MVLKRMAERSTTIRVAALGYGVEELPETTGPDGGELVVTLRRATARHSKLRSSSRRNCSTGRTSMPGSGRNSSSPR